MKLSLFSWAAQFIHFLNVHAHCPPAPSKPLDFGSCSNPGITFGWNLDNSQRYGYIASNADSFPHGWSPDIATIESFICNRLESPCDAPPDTIRRCRQAFNLYSGLAGDDAVDAWNVALGLAPRHSNHDGECPDQPNDLGYLTTIYTTLFVASTVITSTDVEVTTTTQTLTAFLTSIHPKTYTTDTDDVSTPSSTLIITVVLPSTTTTDRDDVAATSTFTSMTFTTTTVDLTTSIVAQTTGITSNDNSDNGDISGQEGGGSPFDPESGVSPTHPDRFTAALSCLGLMTLALAFMLQ